MWVATTSETELIASFLGTDVISAKQFSRKQLELLFKVSDEVREEFKNNDQRIKEGKKPEEGKFGKVMDGIVLSSIFFEPSSRTRDSFNAAVHRMGGQVLGFGDPNISSVRKGESLKDTIRMYDSYGHAIVIRHPSNGSAKLAAKFADNPVINAGSGQQEHPTQAMLDLYTIRRETKKLGNQHIVLVGDFYFGRTGSSLCYSLVPNFDGIDLTFVAPDFLQMRKEVILHLKNHGVRPRMVESPDEVIADADVIYVTRIQKERFSDPAVYDRFRGSYIIGKNLIAKGKSDLIIMHPLPRIDEIPEEVDEMPNAKYIGQADNGKYVRAALLSLILGGYHG